MASETYILDKGSIDSSDLSRPFSIRYSEGHIKVVRANKNTGAPIEITSKTKVDDSQWHHVAFVREHDLPVQGIQAPSLSLYIDGMLDEASGMRDFLGIPGTNNDAPIYIGKRGAFNFDGSDTLPTRFTGQIRDIRIWDRPLLIEDIRANMRSESVVGPIARWKLGTLDRTTGRINDSIGDRHSEPKTDIFNLGKWRFVDVDMCSYELRLYVDGMIVARQPLNGPPKASALPSGRPRLTIGRKAAGGPPSFNGAIDELRVWKVGRERWELVVYQDRALPVNSPGLLGYWRF